MMKRILIESDEILVQAINALTSLNHALNMY